MVVVDGGGRVVEVVGVWVASAGAGISLSGLIATVGAVFFKRDCASIVSFCPNVAITMGLVSERASLLSVRSFKGSSSYSYSSSSTSSKSSTCPVSFSLANSSGVT